MSKADMGLIGLAVMGQNLALNINDHGYTLAVYNRSEEKTNDFLKDSAKDTNILPAYSLQELVSQ